MNPALVGFLLLAWGVPDGLAVLWAGLSDKGIDGYTSIIGVLFAVETVVVFAMIVGLASGRLIVIKSFRALGWSLIAAEALFVASAVLARLRPHAPGIATTAGLDVGFAASLLLVPFALLLGRGLLRIRWLDPRAPAPDWEPPA